MKDLAITAWKDRGQAYHFKSLSRNFVISLNEQ